MNVWHTVSFKENTLHDYFIIIIIIIILIIYLCQPIF